MVELEVNSMSRFGAEKSASIILCSHAAGVLKVEKRRFIRLG